jgi:hypothetical protein
MTKVVNPHLHVTGRNSVCLAWEDPKGDCYHHWLNAETLETTKGGAVGLSHRLRDVPVIYRNGPKDAPKPKPPTRYLDGSAAVNSKMLADALAVVDLKAEMAAAIAKMVAKELEEAEQYRLDYIEQCQKEAGVDLYAALTGLMGAARSMGMRDNNDFYVAAKAAITKADADALTKTAEDFV